MKAAISTDPVSVSVHFGRCPTYTIVDIDNVVHYFAIHEQNKEVLK